MTKADTIARINTARTQSTVVNLLMNWLNTNGHSDLMQALITAMETVTTADANTFKHHPDPTKYLQ